MMPEEPIIVYVAGEDTERAYGPRSVRFVR